MSKEKKILKYPEISEELQDKMDRAYQIQKENADTLCKTMFSLSAVFISVIVGFLKDIRGLLHDAKLAIFIALVFLSISIIMGLCSYKYGIYEAEKHQENMMGYNHDLYEIGKCGDQLDNAHLFCFFLGVVSIAIAVYLVLI